MKKAILFVFIICALNSVYSINYQNNNGFSMEISYWNALVMDGKVSVRENSYIGTKFKLTKDLGISNLFSFDIWLGYRFPKRNYLRISFGRYFFRGHQVLKDNAFFNGSELIKGTDASIDASIYYRANIQDRFLLINSANDFKLFLLFGISLDMVRFHVDGELTDDSPTTETWEQFYRQTLPLPVYGLRFEKGFKNNIVFYSEIYGGFCPGLKLWNWEVSRMRQWQVDLDVESGIFYKFKVLRLGFDLDFQLLYLKGEDVQDTNVLLLYSAGPEFKMFWDF